jgi:excisionase family DNA binding protein
LLPAKLATGCLREYLSGSCANAASTFGSGKGEAVELIPALLVSDRDAAAMLAISRAHLHRLRAAGKLPPAVRLGRAVRWRRTEILAWIEAGCPPRAEWDAMRAAADRRRLRAV